MDGLESETRGRASVVRVDIRSAGGVEAARRYEVRFTPSFVVFSPSGQIVARTSAVDEAARRLRSLLATP